MTTDRNHDPSRIKPKKFFKIKKKMKKRRRRKGKVREGRGGRG